MRIRVMSAGGGTAPWYRCMLRSAILLVVLMGIPLVVLYGARSVPAVSTAGLELGPLTFSLPYLVFAGFYGFFALFLLIEAAMRQPLFYERLSGTSMESTLDQHAPGTGGQPATNKTPQEAAHLRRS